MNKIFITVALLTALYSFTLISPTSPHKKSLTILIDPGHGGHDPGAQGSLINEKDITLGISFKLKEEEFNHTRLVFTRHSDQFKQLKDRIQTDGNKIDLVISIHVGISTQKNESDIKIYYPREGEFVQESKKIANELRETFRKNNLPFLAQNIEAGNFYMLRNANCPAVLIEIGNMNRLEDQLYLGESKNQKVIAQAISQAIRKVHP